MKKLFSRKAKNNTEVTGVPVSETPSEILEQSENVITKTEKDTKPCNTKTIKSTKTTRAGEIKTGVFVTINDDPAIKAEFRGKTAYVDYEQFNSDMVGIYVVKEIPTGPLPDYEFLTRLTIASGEIDKQYLTFQAEYPNIKPVLTGIRAGCIWL